MTLIKSRLYVPTIYDRPQDFERLFQIYTDLQAWYATDTLHSSKRLTIDFQDCMFLAHHGVAMLGGLASQLQERGCEVRFVWQTLAKRIYVNLAQNGFLQAFAHDLQPWEGNAIPYRQDCQANWTAIADYLRQQWLGRGWLNLNPKVRDAIVSQVLEIYLNAFDHSQSKIGVFSCGQHYPNVRTLQLTVVDLGVGIPQKVRSLSQNAHLSSVEAMNWAFQAGTSTKPNGICAGVGLKLLQDFILKHQGQLRIYSNDVALEIRDNKISCTERAINFSGTLINIYLKCDESYYQLALQRSDHGTSWF